MTSLLYISTHNDVGGIILTTQRMESGVLIGIVVSRERSSTYNTFPFVIRDDF